MWPPSGRRSGGAAGGWARRHDRCARAGRDGQGDRGGARRCSGAEIWRILDATLGGQRLPVRPGRIVAGPGVEITTCWWPPGWWPVAGRARRAIRLEGASRSITCACRTPTLILRTTSRQRAGAVLEAGASAPWQSPSVLRYLGTGRPLQRALSASLGGLVCVSGVGLRTRRTSGRDTTAELDARGLPGSVHLRPAGRNGPASEPLTGPVPRAPPLVHTRRRPRRLTARARGGEPSCSRIAVGV